ncbi:MAG TPA: TetR/AcrR family transcriptional regulator [Polyangiaceae bacterium]|nr:TetR/AcrR family transcriptional regulator [Polyangiaceae bacterium]
MPRRDTKQKILSAALKLFRKQGFDRTTMRQIAKSAGTSLGSAYYYFPRKEALVLAYFEDQMALHEAGARAAYQTTQDPYERVLAAFMVRLDLMAQDQKFFGGLLRTLGEPDSSVSVFSEENTPLRRRGIAILREALEVPGVPEAARDDAALMLWALVLGMVLYFVHDTSEGAERTRALAGRAVGLLVPSLALLELPQAQMLRCELRSMLADAKILPDT